MKGQLISVAMLALAGITGAQAQGYPTRSATVVVPFAAGGPADITGRIVADIYSRAFGQQFVVENVAGAGGSTGTTRVARATPDGYTHRPRACRHACRRGRTHSRISLTSPTSISSRSA